MANYFEQRLGSILDYSFDWAGKTNNNPVGNSDWLEIGEIISSFVVSASGITIEDEYLSNNNTSVIIWVSGGEKFQTYDVTCSITTNSSPVARKDSRTMKIKII